MGGIVGISVVRFCRSVSGLFVWRRRQRIRNRRRNMVVVFCIKAVAVVNGIIEVVKGMELGES